MARLLVFPAMLLVVSIWSFWVDKAPRWLSATGIIVSIGLLIRAWRETTIYSHPIWWGR